MVTLQHTSRRLVSQRVEVLPEVHLPSCIDALIRRTLGNPLSRSSAKNQLAESRLSLFSSDLTQRQFKRLRPHPEIRAKRTIEDKDGEQNQRDAHGQNANRYQV